VNEEEWGFEVKSQTPSRQCAEATRD